MKMSTTINQATIEQAIFAHLGKALHSNSGVDLAMSAGRQGRGFSAMIELSHAQIVEAIKAFMSTQFSSSLHLTVELQATRGDDGFTAVVTGTDEAPAGEAKPASTSTAQAVKNAPEPQPTPIPAGENSTQAAGVEAGLQPADAPVDAAGTGELAAEAEAVNAAETKEAADAETKPASIFGGLKRPDNSAKSEG